MRILCFGDSITWGANDLEMGGWPSRLRHYFDNNFGGEPAVYNLGISGEKTLELLDRFEAELSVRINQQKLIIIIAIGINDSRHESYPTPTNPSQFERDYGALLARASKAGSVIVLTPTNVDDNPGLSYKNADIEPYVQIVRRVARAKRVTLVETFGIMGRKDLQGDGLHPEASGHQKITELLIPELNKIMNYKKADLDSAKLYTDGGSRGNPGHSATAFVICNMDDNVVEKTGKYIGVATNNQAEYQALKAGLERVKQLGVTELEVYLDSELVVKQINGQYKIKNADLLPLYQQIQKLKNDFKSIKFIHVPRALNHLADAEVNRILDKKGY